MRRRHSTCDPERQEAAPRAGREKVRRTAANAGRAGRDPGRGGARASRPSPGGNPAGAAPARRREPGSRGRRTPGELRPDRRPRGAARERARRSIPLRRPLPPASPPGRSAPPRPDTTTKPPERRGRRWRGRSSSARGGPGRATPPGTGPRGSCAGTCGSRRPGERGSSYRRSRRSPPGARDPRNGPAGPLLPGRLAEPSPGTGQCRCSGVAPAGTGCRLSHAFNWLISFFWSLIVFCAILRISGSFPYFSSTFAMSMAPW